ncbi:hypothetical protein TGGT1_268400 [Toxoplasma gondii GT1]|uniref:DUF4460 domain-containing protein n=1 Tax=Toxoplasma gondii (strain ATCC 50853 / GT1) TaxID=507601 RepID=S7V5P6_TOXGG|nr:hypothetical protein TGGT1_268400 [Toxoplasma gondii GT1]
MEHSVVSAATGGAGRFRGETEASPLPQETNRERKKVNPLLSPLLQFSWAPISVRCLSARPVAAFQKRTLASSLSRSLPRACGSPRLPLCFGKTPFIRLSPHCRCECASHAPDVASACDSSSPSATACLRRSCRPTPVVRPQRPTQSGRSRLPGLFRRGEMPPPTSPRQASWRLASSSPYSLSSPSCPPPCSPSCSLSHSSSWSPSPAPLRSPSFAFLPRSCLAPCIPSIPRPSSSLPSWNLPPSASPFSPSLLSSSPVFLSAASLSRVSLSPLRQTPLSLSPLSRSSSAVPAVSSFLRVSSVSLSSRRSPGGRVASKARPGSLRRELRFFLLCVHPDRTVDFPEEARRVNAAALSELNAYIDRLEHLLTSMPLASSPLPSSPLSDPFLAKKLTFFVPYRTVTGRVLDGRVRPVCIQLHSIGLHPSRSEIENITENLCCSLVEAVEAPGGQFNDFQQNPFFATAGPQGKSEDATPERLLTSKHAGLDRLQALWDAQTDEVMFKAALYQPDEKLTRRTQLMNREFRRQEAALTRRALRIKNRRVRKRRLEEVASKAEEKVREKFGPDPPEPPPELAEHLRRVAVAEAGSHPDFVFFAPSLSSAQKEEAVGRICGRHLEKESHSWLLQNLLKELRRPPTPIPLIIGTEFNACVERGLFLIPFDFDVWQLADFLEEHLDGVREGRRKLLEKLKDVYR